jgi:predicted RNA-binding Zn-ribbon protein involved in translation (DUF1610 family)
MNIRFACPDCEHPRRLDVPGARELQCPSCDQVIAVPAEMGKVPLRVCLVCGNAEMYRKKDFPHWLGMLILAGACLAFLGLMALHRPWWAWAVLLGSALFDGLLFLFVRDVVVCYRCEAQYRGFPPQAEHGPFDLGVGERYRQERIRREELERGNMG